MKPFPRASLLLLTAVGACAPLPPAGVAADATAVLSFDDAARAYALRQAVHRWVAADVFAYEVELKRRDADGTTFSPIGGGLRTTVALRGANAATKAVFGHLSQGACYRAYVTAKGNAGGTAATTVLNATPATADFDFTATQDVQATIDRRVTVTFDGVPFQGGATLTFGAPAPAPLTAGGATTPQAALTTPPRPYLQGHFRLHETPPEPAPDADLHNPDRTLALDTDGSVWFDQLRVAPSLRFLPTYGLGGYEGQAHLIASNGQHWYPSLDGLYRQLDGVTHYSSQYSHRFRPEGESPLYNLEGAAAGERHFIRLAIDAQDNVYFGRDIGGLVKVAPDGRELASYVAGGLSSFAGLAVDGHGDVWVSEPGTQVPTLSALTVHRVRKLRGSDLAPLVTVDLPRPGKIAADADGNAYVISPALGKWYAISAAGAITGEFTNAGPAPHAIAVDGDGFVWIADPGQGPGHPGTIYRMTPAGEKVAEFPQGPDDHWGQGLMLVDRARRRIWKSNNGSGTLTAIRY